MQAADPYCTSASSETGLSSADDIVCFGSGQWFYVPSVPEYTMLEMAAMNRVLYVEPFVSILTVLQAKVMGKKSAAFRPGFGWGIRWITPRLVVYTPPPIAIPFQHRFMWVLQINIAVLAWLVKRVMRRLKFTRPILWTYLFRLAGMVGRLSEKVAVYDCIEEEEFFAEGVETKQRVRQMEDDLCRRADAVFVLNEQLYRTKHHLNPRTIKAPAGVNIGHFGKASSTDTVIPKDLSVLSHPIIGYFGQVDPWKIDLELLAHVARLRPRWSIVLVGPPYEAADHPCIKGLTNLHILGAKPYEDIPGYLKGFDVCLLPFKVTDGTRNGTPLKLFEYLAAGKPIVSTDIPSAHLFPGLVYVGHSHDDFVNQVEQALSAADRQIVERRLNTARENSWGKRARIIGQVCMNIDRAGTHSGVL